MQTNIMKELSELQKKAVKYENIKASYTEHATKLKEIIKQCQELLVDIDPASSVGGSRNSSGVNFNELAAEVYEKMLSGVHVSSDLVAQTYPNLAPKNVQYLMARIQAKYEGKILKRRDGMKVFLYVLKEQ